MPLPHSEHIALDPGIPPAGDVWKSGLSYRGMFAGDAIQLHLENVRRERGDPTGLLTIEHDARVLYTGRFNTASHTTRTSLAKYLQERDHGYGGWSVVLEEFCRQVIGIDGEGPPTVVLGIQPRRPALAYCIDPVLPQGASTIIFAPGGSFKSTLAAGIAVSVQSGVPLLPDWTPTQGRVLVCDWEADEDSWNDRIIKIAEGLGIPPPQIRYRRCSRRLSDVTESLADQVARENIDLLMVDSVGLAQGSSSDGGDANESTLRMFDALRAIGTTSLLIDHVRGDEIGNGRAVAKPYGSTYKVNLARSVFELRREEQPAYPEASQVLLRHVKVNDAALLKPQGIRIVHGERAILFESCAIDAPDLEQHSGPTHDRMRRLLGRSGEMDEAELSEALGLTRATVRQTMRRHGGFQRNPNGKIGLVVL